MEGWIRRAVGGAAALVRTDLQGCCPAAAADLEAQQGKMRQGLEKRGQGAAVLGTAGSVLGLGVRALLHGLAAPASEEKAAKEGRGMGSL